MSKRLSMLGGLLLAQLLLIGLVTMGSDGTEEARTFLDVEPEAVTGLSIADPDGTTVALEKSADGWQLGGGLPADSNKVADVIETLASESARWPVATSDSAQTRFEVTEDSHQRHIQFRSGDEQVADIYLGTSPGFRRVHARDAAADSVFSIDFAVHEVPTSRGDWLNKSLLQSDSISRVAFSEGQILDRDPAGSGWLIDGQEADLERVTALVERIEQLAVLDFYEPLESADQTLAMPVVLTVDDADGRHQLTFQHDEDDDEYVLSTDRYDARFTVASYVVEQLLLDVDDLKQVPPPQEPE